MIVRQTSAGLWVAECDGCGCIIATEDTQGKAYVSGTAKGGFCSECRNTPPLIDSDDPAVYDPDDRRLET